MNMTYNTPGKVRITCLPANRHASSRDPVVLRLQNITTGIERAQHDPSNGENLQTHIFDFGPTGFSHEVEHLTLPGGGGGEEGLHFAGKCAQDGD